MFHIIANEFPFNWGGWGRWMERDKEMLCTQQIGKNQQFDALEAL